MDTGQDICYNGHGQALTPCPVPGELYYGHDANHRGAAAPDYHDNGDGMVSDLSTGLMWFKRDDKPFETPTTNFPIATTLGED